MLVRETIAPYTTTLYSQFLPELENCQKSLTGTLPTVDNGARGETGNLPRRSQNNNSMPDLYQQIQLTPLHLWQCV